MWNSELESSADAPSKRNFSLLIALIVTVALSIRFTIANGDSLWLDELHTAWAVNDGLSEVGGRAADGNQNPLFFWLTWACVQVLGPSEFSLRLISVLSGTAIVGIAGWFTWRGSKSLTGVILTGLIITLDWRFVFYGTEARPYALMQLLGVLHAALFASLSGWLPTTNASRLSRSTKWSLLTLLSIALFYCHITSVWLFAAEAISLLLVGKRCATPIPEDDKESQPSFFKPLLFSLGAVMVGCLPGMLNLLHVFSRKSNWSDLSSPASVLADTQVPLLFWIALPLVIFVIGYIVHKLRLPSQIHATSHGYSNRLCIFLFAWAMTAIVGVIAVHYLNVAPLASFRYTVIGTPAMAIFAGLMVGRTSNVLLKVTTLVLVAWASYTNNEITRQLIVRQTLPVMRHEDWSTPANTVDTTTADRKIHPRPLLLFANVIEDADAATNLDPRFQEYLRFPVYNIRSGKSVDGRKIIPCPTHQSPRLSKEVIQELVRGTLGVRGGWLLIRGSDATVHSIINEVEATLSRHLPAGSSKKIRIEERNDDGDVVHLFTVDLL